MREKSGIRRGVKNKHRVDGAPLPNINNGGIRRQRQRGI
jgi:hypothetical protein